LETTVPELGILPPPFSSRRAWYKELKINIEYILTGMLIMPKTRVGIHILEATMEKLSGVMEKNIGILTRITVTMNIHINNQIVSPSKNIFQKCPLVISQLPSIA
jgi:hypothetical protein